MPSVSSPPSYSAKIGKFFEQRTTLHLPPPVAYRQNCELVRAKIPAEGLLVFTPADGWKPLSDFLERPVPASEFPLSNAREEFWALFGGDSAAV